MMNGEIGSAVVERLFAETPGVGVLQGPQCVFGEAVDRLSGTHVRVYLQVDKQRIAQARYQVRGCPYTMAALAFLVPQWVGSPVSTLQMSVDQLHRVLDAPADRRGRFLLIEDALRQAVSACQGLA